jgi:hypothetical protein
MKPTGFFPISTKATTSEVAAKGDGTECADAGIAAGYLATSARMERLRFTAPDLCLG